MWYDAMKVIQQWLPDATFTPPNGAGRQRRADHGARRGRQPYDQAAQQLQSAGFTVVDGGYRDSGYPKDTVAYTSPGGGTQVASGTAVTIYRSDGTPYVRRAPHGGNATARATDHGTTGRRTVRAPLERPRRSSSGRPDSLGAELPPDLGGDRAAVGATAHLRLRATPITLPMARMPSPPAPVCCDRAR